MMSSLSSQVLFRLRDSASLTSWVQARPGDVAHCGANEACFAGLNSWTQKALKVAGKQVQAFPRSWQASCAPVWLVAAKPCRVQHDASQNLEDLVKRGDWEAVVCLHDAPCAHTTHTDAYGRG